MVTLSESENGHLTLPYKARPCHGVTPLTPGPAFPPECPPPWHEKGWLITGLFLNPTLLDLVAKGP